MKDQHVHVTYPGAMLPFCGTALDEDEDLGVLVRPRRIGAVAQWEPKERVEIAERCRNRGPLALDRCANCHALKSMCACLVPVRA